MMHSTLLLLLLMHSCTGASKHELKLQQDDESSKTSAVVASLRLVRGAFSWKEATRRCAQFNMRLASLRRSPDRKAAEQFLQNLSFHKKLWIDGIRDCRATWLFCTGCGGSENAQIYDDVTYDEVPDSSSIRSRKECLTYRLRDAVKIATCNHYMAGALCSTIPVLPVVNPSQMVVQKKNDTLKKNGYQLMDSRPTFLIALLIISLVVNLGASALLLRHYCCQGYTNSAIKLNHLSSNSESRYVVSPDRCTHDEFQNLTKKVEAKNGTSSTAVLKFNVDYKNKHYGEVINIIRKSDSISQIAPASTCNIDTHSLYDLVENKRVVY